MDTQSQIDTILECVKKSNQSFYEFKLKDILESITDNEEISAINYIIDNAFNYVKSFHTYERRSQQILELFHK